MASFSIKKTIINGIALALPLGIVFYVLTRFIEIFEKLIAPIAQKIGIENFFGKITLTVLAIAVIIIITFLLGLLMQFSFVKKNRRYLEEWILKLVPSLNQLKLMAEEKLDIENTTSNWKPVLLKNGEQYLPAYIIEENEEWITMAKIKIPTIDPGDLLITKKSAITYTEITMKELRQFNKQFGRGYISFIEKNN
ncbi:MAG: hypothetical protein RIS73_607 [Bacteroidota bacterium]